MSSTVKAKGPRLNQKVKITRTGEPGVIKFIVGNVVTVSLFQREKQKSLNGFFHPSMVMNIDKVEW